MSQENVEIVRKGFEAFNRRDFDAAMDLAHDSLTWKPLFSVETKLLRGRDEVRDAWERQTEAVDIRIDLLELTPLDENRVLAIGKWHGRGSQSGVPFEQTAAQVFTIERGLLRSVDTYADRPEALEAAGLSE